ncbi:MAG: hypothetical protein ACT4QA_16445 [Panacagrimonas sp.]
MRARPFRWQVITVTGSGIVRFLKLFLKLCGVGIALEMECAEEPI